MTLGTVLFIGGTGIISTSCVARAQEQGWSVSVLNRGESTKRSLPDGVEHVSADVRAPGSVAQALGERTFDAVCEFVGFVPEHVQADLETFRGRTGQYVYISSASAYQTPPRTLPVTESTTLANPYWQYSRDKIACEEVLVRAWRDEGFPATIVRPSHTYDRTLLPFDGGWTVLKRMLDGKPVVVHGDGTSLWTLTHATDFAKAFVGLLGQPAALGEAYHITSDEWLSWDAIYRQIAAAADVEPQLVHVASDQIAETIPEWGPGILGDKAHSMIFDNSKVKRVVPDFVCTTPFWQGARQVVEYHLNTQDAQQVDTDLDTRLDELVRRFG